MFKIGFKSVLLVFFASSLMISSAFADRLPSGYPQLNEFQNIGNVDRIDVIRDKIVVNDTLYEIAKDAVVVTPHRKKAALRAVRANSLVGIKVEGNGINQPRTVKEIWVLPKGFKIPDDND
jgi:hypothetical protein